MFLVVIDSHTKWLEVFPTTSFHTIEKLRMLFSSFELYLGQKLKSRLDLLHLDLQGKVESIKWGNRVNLMIDIVDSESSKKTLCLLKTIELVQNG